MLSRDGPIIMPANRYPTSDGSFILLNTSPSIKADTSKIIILKKNDSDMMFSCFMSLVISLKEIPRFSILVFSYENESWKHLIRHTCVHRMG